MQVGMFVNGCSATVTLLLDDAEQAIAISAHIAQGAPDDVVVSHEGSSVTVLRIFETEEDAEDWSRELRDGIEDGYLFNLEIGGVSEPPLH
jgi:hypothetical protein